MFSELTNIISTINTIIEAIKGNTASNKLGRELEIELAHAIKTGDELKIAEIYQRLTNAKT